MDTTPNYHDPDGYTVNTGTLTIRTPGKFEGQPRYMPTVWQQWLDGFSDDNDDTITVELPQSMAATFPELWENGRNGTVTFVATDQGFVQEV